jgi:DNA polymerase I-like protein with 3'-5' exonuclease and polymerase domains
MHKFLEATGKAAIENGYSTTALGRKRFFNKPTYPENILRAYNQSKSTLSMSLYEYAESRIPKYFDYKQNAKAEFVEPMIFAEWKECGPGITPEIRAFMAQASAIGREAANHPIQGGNADVTKHAMVKVRDMFKSKGYYPHAHIMLQVYDELAVVAPTKWREEVNNIIDSAMIEAGEMIITKLPVTIDGHVKGCWTK